MFSACKTANWLVIFITNQLAVITTTADNTSRVLHLGTQMILVAPIEIPIVEVSILADTRVMVFKTVTVTQKTACSETWFCGLLSWILPHFSKENLDFVPCCARMGIQSSQLVTWVAFFSEDRCIIIWEYSWDLWQLLPQKF